jgi:hypothetical protein
MAARMRCAAQLGGIKFGGFLVERGPTGRVAHGTPNLLKKALAMVGSGAKIIDWYNFGPLNVDHQQSINRTSAIAQVLIYETDFACDS